MPLARPGGAPQGAAFAMLVLLSAIGLGACVEGHSHGAPHARHYGDPWIAPRPSHPGFGYSSRPDPGYAPGRRDWYAPYYGPRSYYDRQPHVWRRHDPCVRTRRGSPIIRELKWYKTQTVRVC